MNDYQKGSIKDRAGAPGRSLAFGSGGLALAAGREGDDLVLYRRANPHGGGFGLAPVWKGKALVASDRKERAVEQVDRDYATPDAAVVDAGWAFVLSSDGRGSRGKVIRPFQRPNTKREEGDVLPPVNPVPAAYILSRRSSTSVRMRSASRATSNGFLNASL